MSSWSNVFFNFFFMCHIRCCGFYSFPDESGIQKQPPALKVPLLCSLVDTVPSAKRE